MSSWTVPSVVELYVFFGLTMLIGLVRKNRINDYWSTDPLLATPSFPVYMPRDRQRDLKFLHFSDNIRTPRKKTQPMMKIEKLIQNLQQNFKAGRVPSREICIDESLLLWKEGLKQAQPCSKCCCTSAPDKCLWHCAEKSQQLSQSI